MYGDEYTTSYELGLKGNITPIAFFTLSAYASRTGDAIALITDGCSTLNACGVGPTAFNANAGTVHAHGVEAALSTVFDVAGGRLALDVNGANQAASYVELPPGVPGLPLLGSPVAQNPHWTASATVDFHHGITDDMAGFFHLLYHGQWGGVQDSVTTATPYTKLSTINNVDLRTGIDYKQFEVALFVQNLTNENVPLLKGLTGAVLTWTRYTEPRTIGFNLNYKW